MHDLDSLILHLQQIREQYGNVRTVANDCEHGILLMEPSVGKIILCGEEPNTYEFFINTEALHRLIEQTKHGFVESEAVRAWNEDLDDSIRQKFPVDEWIANSRAHFNEMSSMVQKCAEQPYVVTF